MAKIDFRGKAGLRTTRGQEGGLYTCLMILMADLNSNKELYKARQEINRGGPWRQAAFDFSDDRGRDGV